MKEACFLIIFLGLLGTGAMGQLASVENAAQGTLTVRDGKTDVLTYRFGDQLKPGTDPKYTQSCYIHPLFSLSGQALTDDSPADHLHHRGLFWTWPVIRVRGLNTSTWEPKLPRLRQHFVRWIERETEADAFVLAVENAWKLDGREVVAKEIVTFRIHPTDTLGRAIDLELRLEAVGGPLELQGTPDQNKGYGGLCFRGAPPFTGATMTTDEGALKEDAVHTPFRWADLSNQELGIAVFVSPDHPGYPTKWMIRASYAGIINVSWPGLEAVVLKPGEPVILRYRIYIHRGDAQAGGVRPAYSRYLEIRPQENPQTADRDIVGDLELSNKEDPSYASVASHLPALKRPREAVGVKHHPHDIGVAPDASLELSDDVDAPGSPLAFFEVGEPPARFGAAPAGCSKSLYEGYVPVVLADFDHGQIHYRQTIYGFSERLSRDTELWAYVTLQAENHGSTLHQTEIRFRVTPDIKVNPLQKWRIKLAPGASRKICLRVPFDVRNRKAEEIAEADFDQRLHEVVSFWQKDLNSGMTLSVPEKRINDAYRAWLAFASLDVDKHNGVLEPHDGAGFYELIYGYSAALYAHALDLWGRHEEARQCLDSLLTFQQPDGLFTQNFGTPDSGALLLALASHYELTGDAEWLAKAAPQMVKMADWIVQKRKESRTLVDGKKPATYGLIKFRPYCDHPDPAYDYFGDAYCAQGILKSIPALAAAGLTKDAKRLSREAGDYARDILNSMDAAVVERDGLQILPMEPETHRLLKSTGYRSGGYYGLIAGCMLESGFLEPRGKKAGWVMKFIEERGGLRLGMAEFGGGIDHAYTYGYWLYNLILDRVKPVILGFYGSLAYGMSRDTYSGVEVTKLFSGENDATLPHLYSCTQQLRLLRNMLVREDAAGHLWIGQAMPRPWLEAGQTVEIRDAPTIFGRVSFRIENQADSRRVVIEFKDSPRSLLRSIFLRLRDPSARAIATVRVNGKRLTSFDKDTIRLGTPHKSYEIRVDY